VFSAKTATTACTVRAGPHAKDLSMTTWTRFDSMFGLALALGASTSGCGDGEDGDPH
jgi:hypothetical protein